MGLGLGTLGEIGVCHGGWVMMLEVGGLGWVEERNGMGLSKFG